MVLSLKILPAASRNRLNIRRAVISSGVQVA